MFKKRILLADANSQRLDDFRQALGERWEVSAVADGNAALVEMERRPSDVLVADLDLAELDGVELLNRIQTAYPKTIRFILANNADRERMMKQVLGAHQFLGKPLDISTLKNSVERVVALDRWIANNSIRELVARIRTLPTIPSLYLEVVAALKSPNATTEQVSAIIARDMAMMTKLLLVINSAGFGLSRKITNPTEAIGLLGFETVKSMVMTIKLLSQYDKVKPVYFSIDKLWRHSTDVARTAKQLTLMQTEDSAMAEAAFTAGLMHDLGKVVLAANFDEQYRGAQSLARKRQIPLWEVEKEIFGASHGEIGAYLLGLWGMPLDVVEVAALHHQPLAGIHKTFSPLTAVHIANVIEHEINPDKEGWVESKFDEIYLAETGVLQHVELWKAAAAKRDFNKTEFKVKSAAKTSAVQSPAPTKNPTPVIQPPPARGVLSFARNQWVYGIIGAAVVLLMMAWMSSEMFLRQMEKPQVVPSDPQAAKPVSMPITTPPKPTLASSSSQPAQVASSPTPPAKTPIPASLEIAPVKSAPKEPGFANLKLQGIFYSTSHPAAIISGRTVQVNDHINGVLIVGINDSSVTLQYNDQLKTLAMR